MTLKHQECCIASVQTLQIPQESLCRYPRFMLKQEIPNPGFDYGRCEAPVAV